MTTENSSEWIKKKLAERHCVHHISLKTELSDGEDFRFINFCILIANAFMKAVEENVEHRVHKICLNTVQTVDLKLLNWISISSLKFY